MRRKGKKEQSHSLFTLRETEKCPDKQEENSKGKKRKKIKIYKKEVQSTVLKDLQKLSYKVQKMSIESAIIIRTVLVQMKGRNQITEK